MDVKATYCHLFVKVTFHNLFNKYRVNKKNKEYIEMFNFTSEKKWIKIQHHTYRNLIKKYLNVSECGPYKYGVNCTLDCGHCKRGVPCSVDTGNCSTGCLKGWSGTHCTGTCWFNTKILRLTSISKCNTSFYLLLFSVSIHSVADTHRGKHL